MNLPEWAMIGLIIGVVSTAWRPVLMGRLLLLNMSMGAIGSISAGVVGYILYGSSIDGFNLSVFAFALMATVLITVLRKKFQSLSLHPTLPQIQVTNPQTTFTITNA